MLIHSFDAVLRQPRSLHSIELMPGSKRMPLPRPLPWIGILYFVGVLLAVAVFDNAISFVGIISSIFAPLVGTEPRLAAFLLVYVGIPAGIVYVAMNAEIDGRAPHRWVVSSCRFIRRPKRTWAGRPMRAEGSSVRYRGKMRFWWDLAAPRLHHGWVTGGRVSCRDPVRFTHSWRHQKQVMRSHSDGVLVHDHAVEERLEVRL